MRKLQSSSSILKAGDFSRPECHIAKLSIILFYSILF